MTMRWLTLGSTLLCLAGCNAFDDQPYDESDLPPEVANGSRVLFKGEVVRSDRAAPISGGTLLVARDGVTAVAADQDRDRVFLVDLTTKAVRAVPTQVDTGLGRVIEGPSGTVYVVERRAGDVLEIDIASATITRTIPVCHAPNGIAYDGASTVHVACRSGALVSFDVASGTVTRRLALEDDLRDVLVKDSDLIVTRFRKAQILRIDAAGNVTRRQTPTPTSLRGVGTASVAFRAVNHPNGQVVLTHLISSDTELGTGFGAYYGGACGAVVDPVMTVVDPDNGYPNYGQAELPMTVTSTTFHNLSGPLDLAISNDGNRMALLGSGNSWVVDVKRPALIMLENTQSISQSYPVVASPCGTDEGGVDVGGEPVAVAFDGTGHFVVQSREPATLELEDRSVIRLSDESHADTGLAMFHVNTTGGVACTSCHPEGIEDGHVWQFSAFGPRRTQQLAGGAGVGEPFHWSGDLATFKDLMQEVMLSRMALPAAITVPQTEALRDWIGKIPAPQPADDLDEQAVARGQQLFESPSVGCVACHSGSQFSDDMLHDVGTGGEFVTPSLVGVGLRAPLMHDGCAATLRDRFGACGGTVDSHGLTSKLSATDVDDMLAFLRSL